MLSNDDMQRLKRLVNLVPLMTQEMRQELLDLVRKLKAAESQACGLPASAIADLERAVPTELVQAIVEDQRHGVGVPGWLPPSKSEPVVRGTGWQSPAKVEERSRQFAVFDAMVAHMVGGPNEPVK
jgi:hypothetical protein